MIPNIYYIPVVIIYSLINSPTNIDWRIGGQELSFLKFENEVIGLPFFHHGNKSATAVPGNDAILLLNWDTPISPRRDLTYYIINLLHNHYEITWCVDIEICSS